MADQSIASTASSGYITLPDGRTVPSLDTWFNQQANNPQGMGAAEQRTQLGQGYSKYVAQPVTNHLGDFLTGPLKAAEAIGLVDPEGPVGVGGRKMAQGIASTVVPQDLPQLGIDAGILASGGAAAALKVGKGLSAASRVMGGAAGGMVGGALEYGDTKGALTGAGRGLVQSVVGEGIGAVADYARKMGVERTTRKIQEIDATQFTKAMKANPKLQGVFAGVPESSDGLHDLLKGSVPDPKNGLFKNKADAMLGQKLDAYDATIQGLLDQQKQRHGRSYLFPLLKEQAGRTGVWGEAREQLTELGRIARRAKPGTTYDFGEHKLTGTDVKQLYAESLRSFQKELTYVDGLHGTQTLKAFNEAREMEAAAQYYLNALDVAFSRKTEGRRMFNTDRVQNFLDAKRKSQTEGMNRLGPEGFQELAGAVRLDPSRIGQVDVYSPHGALSQIAGVAPLPGAAYARFHIGAPKLVGDPLAMIPQSRTGMNLATSQLTSPLGQMGQDMLMQQPQGIPGLK